MKLIYMFPIFTICQFFFYVGWLKVVYTFIFYVFVYFLLGTSCLHWKRVLVSAYWHDYLFNSVLYYIRLALRNALYKQTVKHICESNWKYRMANLEVRVHARVSSLIYYFVWKCIIWLQLRVRLNNLAITFLARLPSSLSTRLEKMTMILMWIWLSIEI